VKDFGRFRVLDAPGEGYFDLVDAPVVVPIDRHTFYGIADRWLHSDWLAARQYLWLDLKGGAPSGLPRISAAAPLPPVPPPGGNRGAVTGQQQAGQVYEAELDVTRHCMALFRMTWHPDWVAYLDGVPQKTAMLSPGFLGVPVSPGRHRILCRYQVGFWRVYLAVAGFLLVGLMVAAEWRRTPAAPLPEPPPDPAHGERPTERRRRHEGGRR